MPETNDFSPLGFRIALFWRSLTARTAAVLLPTILLFTAASAQTFTGAIGGRVADWKGVALPGVTVSATEVATNIVTRTVSGPDGVYLIPRLNPGVYKASFSAAGFALAEDDQIQVQIDNTYKLDKQLTLGAAGETVVVVAADNAINYETPEVAYTISSELIGELPEEAKANRGRVPYLLVDLVPGVTSTKPANNNFNNVSLGGGRPVTNELLIDGLPSTNPSDNTYTFAPSPDAVDELKVFTLPFSAEFGHTGGGVLLANTKHGTNVYHGSLYSYFNNRHLNARNYFQSGDNLRYDQTDPGFTFSGPLVLPGYNGHNKTFFFMDYNVTSSAQAVSTNSIQLTPTDRERQGDFSRTPGITAIYDPNTTQVDASGNVTRTAFPGNIIPASRIDSVAAQIVKYFPEPNGNFSGGNYQLTPTQYNRIQQGLIRFDHVIGDKDTFFARYGRWNPNTDAVNYTGNIANTDNTNGWYDNQAVANETHTFSPRASNDFRLGFVQEINYTLVGGQAPASLGLKGVTLTGFPDIATTNFLPLGASGPSHDRDRSWVFVDNVLLQRGTHFLKMGGDFRRQMYHYWNPGLTTGSYTFDQTYTSITSDPSSGFDLADLLLGLPTVTQITSEDYTYHENINSASLYVQDDWKLLPNLTINLGLRWEFDGPYTERDNQLSSFDPLKVNSQTGNLGDAIFAGRDGAPRHFRPNIYHDFLPRVGFVYSPLPKTVIRAGFGAFRLPEIGFYYIGPLSIYVQNGTIQSANGITPPYQLENGVPNVPFSRDAQGNPLVYASLSNPTSTPVWIDSRERTPYNLSWQFGLERQFGSWSTEIDYVATHGVKLPVEYTADQLQPGQFATGSQSLRPFPQYADVQFFTPGGASNYQSLQAQLQRQWKSGLVVSIAYTFSKLLDDVDANDRVENVGVQNAYNLHTEWGLGGYDVPQRLVGSYVYQLPFGRGHSLAGNVPVLKDVITGWQLSGVTSFQSGQVLPITQNNETHGFTESQRPNVVPGTRHFGAGGTVARWFNTAAFTVAPAYTLGNAARYPLHGPGIDRSDIALQRSFRLSERFSLMTRGEFFNVFNHPQFDNPDGEVDSTTFGVVNSAEDGRVGQLAAKLTF